MDSYAVALSLRSEVWIGNRLRMSASRARELVFKSNQIRTCLGGFIVGLGIVNPSASVFVGNFYLLRLN